MWRNGEMRERRIAECYRGIEMPKRLVQIGGFALKERQLHGWTVCVGAQRELYDAGATPSVITASQVVDQLRRATSQSRVRERLLHMPIEIALLQVACREELRATRCCGSSSSERVAQTIMSS